MRQNKFSEADTEAFYDSEDSLYRSFWDSEGSLHWGYFEDLTEAKAENFITACKRWNEYMLSQSGITKDSRVLDLGCGNGNTAIWLSQQTGCEVVGIDISSVRVENAKTKAKQHPSLRLEFIKASATDLPYQDKSFTHVWSQATLYHVHDRHQALREVHRVLEEGGRFIFDDLISPTQEINEMARKYVYDRLLFEPIFSLDSYKEFLSELGFMVLATKDLKENLHKSYELLSQLALAKYPELSAAYDKMCEAIQTNQLGWGYYSCEKVSDRLSWIYKNGKEDNLEQKYDAWASVYDTDLDQPYRCSPVHSANALAKVLPNKDATILDAGAGTGMVGEALAELGYTNIVGVDLSEKMLEVARKKQVYTALYQGNLEEPLAFTSEASYDAILSVGVFTFGHAHPRALKSLSSLLKKSGYFILTVRVDYYNQSNFLHEILQNLPWNIITQEQFNIFETEPMYVLVYQKS
ncbi:methyltransferase domain-containing protein [Okeania sp. SIO1I7]|uniref:methyltransferase domain-containing protein n=1 Tax=Okeania sp. SIO1I7 TaxID=2607772 RepID=UPI0013F983D0|nr:methyltransferase domain-containing protein [Okeania sp. SIO1I7]NET25264.1 methyltransferase domain-containing protein [Okeania sp. SIO1I7]